MPWSVNKCDFFTVKANLICSYCLSNSSGFSSNNIIQGCLFENIRPDPVRIRRASSNNIIEYNDIKYVITMIDKNKNRDIQTIYVERYE